MKELTEQKKRLIAEMWQQSDLSIGAIAAAMKVSRDTVNKYKNQWIGQQRL
jgi:predicted transcriptional regulator